MDVAEVWRLFVERRLAEPYPRRVTVVESGRIVGHAVARSWDEAVELIRACSEAGQCFVSKYPEHMERSRTADVVVLDIDLPMLHEKYREAILDFLSAIGVERFNAVFSGRRGFHIYIPVETLPFAIVEAAVRRLREEYETPLWGDVEKVTLSPAGLIRVPHTRHEKSNMYSVVADIESESLTEIVVRAKTNRIDPGAVEAVSWEPDRGFTERMLRLASGGRAGSVSIPPPEPEGGWGKPPCVECSERILRAAGELDHMGRLLIAMYYRLTDATVDDVVEIFRAASDFDEAKTRYQVEHAWRKGYKPYKCSRILGAGLCPYSQIHRSPNSPCHGLAPSTSPRDCPFYPWMCVRLGCTD